jgi:hypothetical protein
MPNIGAEHVAEPAWSLACEAHDRSRGLEMPQSIFVLGSSHFSAAAPSRAGDNG